MKGRGGGVKLTHPTPPTHTEKTTLKKPSLIRVNKEGEELY